MTLELTLRTDDTNRLTVTLDGQALAKPTLLTDLPALPALQEAPYAQGRALTDGLGGDDLLARLRDDPDQLLLLDADDAAAAIPWEYAALDGRQLLACRYSLLRLIDRPAGPAPHPDTLRFLVLGADPLVDDEGNPREGYRLRINDELRAIRRTLGESGVDLTARRIPPTAGRLHAALLHGPAILHLSCHGDVVQTDDGPLAVLLLEDENGQAKFFHGADLVNLPPPGVLRLVVLNACHTAAPPSLAGRGEDQGDDYLARALVQNGLPAAIGMQGSFFDPLSDDFAVPLYRHLLAGHSLAEALRQARVGLSNASQVPAAAGQPVCYVARDEWGSLSLREGRPSVYSLRLPGAIRLPTEVQAPRPLRGRNGALHDLARFYTPRPEGGRVVTVVGSGGVGKTALAAAFAERFGYRWPEGVLGLSFAAAEPDSARFRADLLRGLLGEAAAQTLADAPPAGQARAILDRLRDWDGLLLLDNYESVLQGLGDGDTDAVAVHQLVAQAANGGASLLLTSRQQPAKLRGERVFPRSDHPLPGLRVEPGAVLFLEHSPRATDEGERGLTLAGWGDELAQAEDYGLAGHHRTFGLAFDRSYERLPAALQTRLRALSRFPFPFLVEGAVLMWGLSGSDDDLAAARQDLHQLVQRSLLEVDGYFEDSTPATYRFQPALRQALARRVSSAERAALEAGFAAYGYWFADMAFGQIGRQPGVARLAQMMATELVALVDTQPDEKLARYCWRLGYILQMFGHNSDAEQILARGAAHAEAQGDDVRRERILLQQANLSVLRGDLDSALCQYEEAARLAQTEDNKGEYSAVLHQMASVYLTRGDLDRTLELYQESLQIDERLGDLQGKGASLSNMAQVYLTRGDLDRALELYQESLQILTQIGDLKGKGASLSMVANVYMAMDDWEQAEESLTEALEISRQLGELSGVAFNTVKLGQVAQARGDASTALARYREGLAIFERLGMPEAEQVRQMIAAVTGKKPGFAEKTRFLTSQASVAAQAGDGAGAVAALEEVVGLDERTGHPDLESDRKALEQARLAAQSPISNLQSPIPNLQSLISNLPPEERAQMEAAARQFARQWEQMSEEEQAQQLAAMQAAGQREQIESLANQARAGAIAALRGKTDRERLIAQIENVAAQAAEDEQPGSPSAALRTGPWYDLAAYLRAVVALLRGEPLPPVPERYAAHVAAIQNA